MKILHHRNQVKPKNFKKPTSKQFLYSEEIVIELRGMSLNFLKLDLAYLATILAVIGALKLQQTDILEYLSSARYFIFVFLFLCAVDVFVYNCLLQDWVHIKTKQSRDASNQKVAKYAIRWQSRLHLMFLSLTLVYVTGFATGGVEVRERYRALAQIQDAVERYIQKNKKLPTDATQIIDGEITEKAVERFGIERIKIEPSSKGVYVITIDSGDKGRSLYTIDGSVKASEIFREIEKDKK